MSCLKLYRVKCVFDRKYVLDSSFKQGQGLFVDILFLGQVEDLLKPPTSSASWTQYLIQILYNAYLFVDLIKKNKNFIEHLQISTHFEISFLNFKNSQFNLPKFQLLSI